jgi:hypothetical protein
VTPVLFLNAPSEHRGFLLPESVKHLDRKRIVVQSRGDNKNLDCGNLRFNNSRENLINSAGQVTPGGEAALVSP